MEDKTEGYNIIAIGMRDEVEGFLEVLKMCSY